MRFYQRIELGKLCRKTRRDASERGERGLNACRFRIKRFDFEGVRGGAAVQLGFLLHGGARKIVAAKRDGALGFHGKRSFVKRLRVALDSPPHRERRAKPRAQIVNTLFGVSKRRSVSRAIDVEKIRKTPPDDCLQPA